MAATYGLFDLTEKEWIDLGKPFNNKFQTESDKIVEFLNHRNGNILKLLDDMENTPDELEEGWIEV